MNTQASIAKFTKRAQDRRDSLASYSQKELEISPTPESWNMLQLYDHVMKVAYSYQIPNLKLSLTPDAVHTKKKNIFGYLLFDRKFLPRINIRMEDFPQDLREKFTPELKSKEKLLEEFEKFISDVVALENTVSQADKQSKTYHPMFGTIATKNRFELIEIHMRHHEKQRKRIANAIDATK